MEVSNLSTQKGETSLGASLPKSLLPKKGWTGWTGWTDLPLTLLISYIYIFSGWTEVGRGWTVPGQPGNGIR
jgi:hypothetical protein